jgi:UDP-N-acetylmuramyl tripeptide synthase
MVGRRVSPGVVGRWASTLGPITLVSGTNGKTTTALTLATILRASTPGLRAGTIDDAWGEVIANPSGANLSQAIATAILERAGAARGRPAVFEVDEAALPTLLDEMDVRLLVLTNLFRDQLDRFGETDRIISRWREALARQPGVAVVSCADDPRLAALVAGRSMVTSFGLAEPAPAPPGPARMLERATIGDPGVTTDVTTCPVCGGPLVTRWTSIGHLGAFRCGSCRFARRDPDVAVRVVEDAGLDGQRLGFRLRDGQEPEARVAHIGLANAYNCAAAIAAAIALGLSPADGAAGLEQSRPAFARWERLEMEGRRVVLTLVKNPASLDEVTRAGRAARLDGVVFAMADQHADGRDTSWYWDVDPTPLVPGRLVALSGPRAPDIHLRLRYQLCESADAPLPGLVGTFERPLDALDAMVARVPAGGSILVVSTYTALLGLREALHRRGLVPAMPR